MAKFLHSALEIIGATSLCSWIYLLLFRGRFWTIRESTAPRPDETASWPKVAVLIPARDEANVIAPAVTSLLTQNYPGRIDVLVIDDSSSDGTREVALDSAKKTNASDKLQVLSARALPPGWTGKLWALSEGIRTVEGSQPDYFLLTDADIVHSPDNVRDLVARVQAGNFDLVSLMVQLRCESAAERALIPAFLFFFFMLYPPAWVSQMRRKTAAAAGGCILLRPGALARIGGIDAIRNELIDDCALAKRVKETGGRIHLGATTHTRSLRQYGSSHEIEQMIARTAFTQLHHSVTLLVATMLAMIIVFIAPPFLLLGGSVPFCLGAAAWLLMSICFWPCIRLYKLSSIRALTLPAVAFFYILATVHSAILYWRGRGGMWKGRVQDSASVRH